MFDFNFAFEIDNIGKRNSKRINRIKNKAGSKKNIYAERLCCRKNERYS